MELRRNIILSLAMHAAAFSFTAALVASGVTPLRVAGKSLSVVLMEETGAARRLSQEREERGGPAMSSATNEPSARSSPPEITRKREEAATASPADSVPAMESRGRSEVPSPVYRGDRPAHEGYGSSAPSSKDSMHVSLTDSPVSGVKESSGHDASAINVIRAAIERAKAYPVFARKRRQEGTVVTEFSINGKGHPEDIRIVQSSGFSLLDTAARDTIMRAAPFPVVKGNIEVPIRFILDPDLSERR